MFIFICRFWGFLCPVHTPDGEPCGLLNHMTSNCRKFICFLFWMRLYFFLRLCTFFMTNMVPYCSLSLSLGLLELRKAYANKFLMYSYVFLFKRKKSVMYTLFQVNF